ncbi:hypothetical protein JCM31739_13860 [Faecalimonas canis]
MEHGFQETGDIERGDTKKKIETCNAVRKERKKKDEEVKTNGSNNSCGVFNDNNVSGKCVCQGDGS